jgi:peptidyl-prolyl cis-trans isomerase SurA
MRRALAILLPALLAASPTVGPAAAQQAPASPPRGQVVEARAVLVNDEPISLSDVRKRMQLILMSLGTQQPDEETIREAQQQATESLIEEKIQVQEFKKLAKDATISDAEINQRLAQISQRNGQTLEAFVTGLAQRGVSVESLREQIRADIAWQNLIGGRFGRQVRVSEARVDEAMRRMQESLDKPQYHVAEIFLYAPDTGSRTNAMNRAATLKTQIEQGAPFEQVAMQFSAAPTALTGGDLGWMTRGDMRPEFISAVEAARPPSILPPIETEGGVYLLAVVGKREPADPNAAMLNIKQAVASGDDAAAKLAQLRSQNLQCPAVNAAAEAVGGVTVTDIPNVALADLTDDIRTAVDPLQPGQSTAPLDVRSGKAVLFICNRQLQGAQIPTRENIKDRLFDTEISMLADRYLRDLKRDATIIRR